MAQAGEPREAYGVRAACCRCPMPLRDEDGGRPANRSAAQQRQPAARTPYAGAPSERSPRLESAPLTPAGSTQNSEEPLLAKLFNFFTASQRLRAERGVNALSLLTELPRGLNHCLGRVAWS